LIGHVTTEPHSVISNGIPTNSHGILLHQVKQKVVEAATGDENLLTDPDVTIFEPIIQYLPPLLQNPKSTFYILTNTLYVR
jgi:hypothetical protein